MDFMLVLIGLVMFAALIGMIVCSKKQKTNPNAQPVAIVLLLIVVACGGYMMYRTGIFGDNTADKFVQIENQYQAAQGNVLGQFIDKNFAGAKVLVIADTNYAKDPRTSILVEAIKAGMGGKGDITVDTIEPSNLPKAPVAPAPANAPAGAPKMPVPEMTMPLFETMVAKDFDAAIAKNASCTVVITTVGLPRDSDKMKLWTMPADKAPKLILLGAMDTRGIGEKIKKDKVAAVISVSPDAKFTEDAPPSDPQKAFDSRYILITKANIDKYGKLVN
jgi:hypothetical protein